MAGVSILALREMASGALAPAATSSTGTTPGASGNGTIPPPPLAVVVTYKADSGDIQGYTAIFYSDSPLPPRICDTMNNGTGPDPGRGCLDVTRDPNLKAFLSDAQNGRSADWQVNLQTLTLQRRP